MEEQNSECSYTRRTLMYLTGVCFEGVN